MRRFSLLSLLLTGCIPDFETVDESCKDEVPGAKEAPAEAADFFTRVGCYRRFVGIAQGRIRKPIQRAAESHLNYMVLNGSEETDFDWFSNEDPTKAGYTGGDIFERLSVAEYNDIDASSRFVWYTGGTMENREEIATLGGWGAIVDGWVDTPYLRQVVFQPAWEGAGLAYTEVETTEGTKGLHYGHIITYLPPAQREGNPIVYPKDGQTDVPLTYIHPDDLDDNPDTNIDGIPPGAHGYAITATFGSDEVVGLPNYLGIQVASAIVTGPEGVLPAYLVLPRDSAYGLLAMTVILVPYDPLLPGTTYSVEMTATWAGDHQKTMEWSFTTAAGDVQAREQRPSPLPPRLLAPPRLAL